MLAAVLKLVQPDFATNIVFISEEQAVWLAAELRSDPRSGTMGAEQSMAIGLEHAMGGTPADHVSVPTHDGLRAVLAIVSSDRIDTAPGPHWRLGDLRNAIAAVLDPPQPREPSAEE